MYGLGTFQGASEELFHNEWIERGRQLRNPPVKVVVAPADCLERKLCPQLEENGYCVTPAKNRGQLLDYIGSETIRGNGIVDIDAIVVDAEAAGGLDMAQALRHAHVDAPMVLLGHRTDLRYQVIQRGLGDVLCVRMPIGIDHVLLLVKNIIAKPRKRRPTGTMAAVPTLGWHAAGQMPPQPFVVDVMTHPLGNSSRSAREKTNSSTMGRRLTVQ